MSVLSDQDRALLETKFDAELVSEVTLTYFTQHESGLSVPGLECPGCRDTRQLLEEVAAISPKIRLEVRDFVAQEEQAKALGIDKIPATVLQAHTGGRLRFYGVPSGYEFATLVEDIIALSKGNPGLSTATAERLKEVTKPTRIQVFITPT